MTSWTKAWIETYADLIRAIESRANTPLFFRGHSNTSWLLLPKIARAQPTSAARIPFESEVAREVTTFCDFGRRAGNLLPAGCDSWERAFAMQHHGVPTRLLDWTTSAAVAVYFAIRDASETAAVWVLDPFELNERGLARNAILSPPDLPATYEEYFIASAKVPLNAAAVALFPPHHNPRISRQMSGFTLHADLSTPLEMWCPAALRKVEIPTDALPGAKQFLALVGISEFALFPDLDGLSRDVNHAYF